MRPGRAREADLHALLLQAAFAHGDQARGAWEQWKAQVDLEGTLDSASFSLLPFLHRNLQALAISDPLTMRLRGISRQNWLRNQLALQPLEGVAAQMDAAGISLLLLDGQAMAWRYCSDYYLSAARHSVFLVPREQAAAAIGRLQRSGWTADPPLADTRPETAVAAGDAHFLGDEAGNRIHLHWRLPPLSYHLDIERDFWAESAVWKGRHTRVRVLNPADQLLHLCLPQDARGKRPLIQRAVDVMVILSAAGEGVDWDRVAALAVSHHLAQPLKETLTYLHAGLGTALPNMVWLRILALPVPGWERMEHRWKSRQTAFWGRVPDLWFNHCRRSAGAGGVGRLLTFSRLLQRAWGLEHGWQVPFESARRGWRRLRADRRSGGGH